MGAAFSGGVVRWTLALLSAYVLMQVVRLPVPLVSVLSPARAVAVGAAFPVFAGTVQQAPKWMQDRWLEWLFRLRAEFRLWVS